MGVRFTTTTRATLRVVRDDDVTSRDRRHCFARDDDVAMTNDGQRGRAQDDGGGRMKQLEERVAQLARIETDLREELKQARAREVRQLRLMSNALSIASGISGGLLGLGFGGFCSPRFFPWLILRCFLREENEELKQALELEREKDLARELRIKSDVLFTAVGILGALGIFFSFLCVWLQWPKPATGVADVDEGIAKSFLRRYILREELKQARARALQLMSNARPIDKVQVVWSLVDFWFVVAILLVVLYPE